MSEKKATKKTSPKKKQSVLKITESDKQSFPYNQFPVKIIHKDGKRPLRNKNLLFSK